MPEPSNWEGRSRANITGYKIFVWLLQTGGIRSAYLLLHFVTLYYRLFVPQAIRPLKYLYARRLGYSARQSGKLIRRNLLIFGQTLIDRVAVLAGVKHSLSFAHEGQEYLEEMVRQGRGGLVVSAHLGNWEVAGHLLKRYDTVINILMYDGEAEQIRQYMNRFEEKRSFNVILIKDDISHVYEISAALQRNELVCLHADRYRPGNRTIAREFLGKEALFPFGPFVLASKLRAPVCFVFAFKETNFHYHFYAYPPKVYEGRGTEGVGRMLDDYVALLEQGLKKYPEQWFNYFEFWKEHAN